MSQTLSATFRPSLEVAETLPINLASTVSDATLVPTIQYDPGNSNSALCINASFMKAVTPVTLNSAANSTYVLTSLTDDAGRSVTMAGGVRLLVLYVTSRTAGDYLTVGNAGTNPWTSFLGGTTPTLKVFDFLALAVGSTDKYAVTTNSNEQLKITNSGNSAITFKIALLGCAS